MYMYHGLLIHGCLYNPSRFTLATLGSRVANIQTLHALAFRISKYMNQQIKNSQSDVRFHQYHRPRLNYNTTKGILTLTENTCYTEQRSASHICYIKLRVFAISCLPPLISCQKGVSQNLPSVTNASFCYKLLKSLLLIGYQQIWHWYTCKS